MASVHVFWTDPGINFDEDMEMAFDERELHTGILTDEGEHASEEVPVVIEDLTGRIYMPGDFPEQTVLFVESAPGNLPPVAEAAAEAGYNIAHAEQRGRGGPEVHPPEQEPVDPRTEPR